MTTTQPVPELATVSGYMSWDPDCLDGILAGVRRLVEAVRPA